MNTRAAIVVAATFIEIATDLFVAEQASRAGRVKISRAWSASLVALVTVRDTGAARRQSWTGET